MKKLFSILLALVCSVGMALADVVTFTFKTDTDITYTATGTPGGGASATVSKSNVILAGSNAYTDETKTLSCYAKSTLTITAPGNITNIALEYNGKVYPFDEAVGNGSKGTKFSTSGAHAASYTPTTPATSVTLNNTNGGKTELLTLTVTYTASSIVNVTGVTLDQTSATLVVGQKLTLAATVAPANATNKLVNWASDDVTVATVDNGVVSAKKAGSATITATTVDGSKTATCAVTVNAKTAPAGAIFFESFDAFDGDGGNDGVWSNISTTTDWDAADCDNEGWTTQGMINKGSQCVSIRKSTVATGGTTVKSGVKTPAIGTAGNGRVQFLAEAWGGDTGDFYVDILGGGTFKVGQTGVTLSNNNMTAKVALQKKGVFKEYTIEFEKATENTQILFYMASGKRGFLDEVAVWVTPADQITISAAGYATYFNSTNAYIMPDDCEGYVFFDGALEPMYEGGDNVPAGEPLVIYTIEPGTKTLEFITINSLSLKAQGYNLLDGTDEETALTADDDYYFYGLSLNAAGELNSVGFYWMNANGAAFTNGAHKAYLKLAKSAGAPERILFNQNPVATDIENAAAIKATKALVNGNIVIIRNGAKFNLNGMLVKSCDYPFYPVNPCSNNN